MDLIKVSALISNTLTVPTIILSIMVVYIWFKPSLEVIRSPHRTTEGWFIIGVSLGFLGEILDGAYWFLAWNFSYFGAEEQTQVMLEYGPFFNIFFRQLMTILAAYCHIRSAFSYSAEVSKEKTDRIRRLPLICIISGLMYCLFTLIVSAHLGLEILL